MEDATKKQDRQIAAAQHRIAILDDENQTLAQYAQNLQGEVAALKQRNEILLAEKEREQQRQEGELAAENRKLAALLEAEKKTAEAEKNRALAQFQWEKEREEGWREGLRAHFEKELAARDEKLGAAENLAKENLLLKEEIKKQREQLQTLFHQNRWFREHGAPVIDNSAPVQASPSKKRKLDDRAIHALPTTTQPLPTPPQPEQNMVLSMLSRFRKEPTAFGFLSGFGGQGATLLERLREGSINVHMVRDIAAKHAVYQTAMQAREKGKPSE